MKLIWLILIPTTIWAETLPSALLLWDEVPGATAYRVERTVPGVAFGPAGETTDLWMRNTLPDAVTTYLFRVAARGTNGDLGEWSPQVSYKFSNVQPAAPTNLRVTNVPSQTPGRSACLLSWNAVTNSASGVTLPTSPPMRYKLYRYTAAPSTGASGQIITTTTYLNYTDDGLPKNKTFYWVVAAEFDYTDRYIESHGSSAVRGRT